MKTVKIALALLLLSAMILSMASCNFGSPQESDTSKGDNKVTDSDTQKDTEDSGKVTEGIEGNKVPKECLKNYRIVVDTGLDDSVNYAANSMSILISKIWGYKRTVKDISYATPDENAYEILIGMTDRPESEEYISSLTEGQGGYTVIGRRIVVGGYDAQTTVEAVKAFCHDVLMRFSPERDVYMSDRDEYTDDLSGRISILSFNVYVGIQNNDARASSVINQIKAYNPDLFGVQEASPKWKQRLEIAFGDEYEIVGEPRENGGEGTYVFVRKSKFNVLTYGTKWLTDTPDEKSKLKDSLYYRIFTYVTVETEDGRRMNFASAHLDNSSNGNVRKKQVECMVASLEANVDASLPTAVVGDFNAYPNLSTYERMTDFGFLPAYELSDVGDGEKTPTFEDGTVLDYCFLRNTDSMDVLSYRVYNRSEFGQASDHYPLYTQIEYKKAP